MKRKVIYQMNGVLNVRTGQIVSIDKDGSETVYNYSDLLKSLDGQEIKMKIDHIEYCDDEEDSDE